ncbi:hypothetical protein [Duganella sp.]|uniref:hypothetical protein n=1 Tax=Duganella sp. TaxID=1904440 RepID=UPI0031D38872
MNPTSLDKQSGAADDTHIVRIVRLETQMDNVASAITSLQRGQEVLQRTIEQNQQATLKQFAVMNDKIDSVRDDLRDKIHATEWRLLNRMDRQFYWLVGLFVTNMTITVSILVRLTAT